MKLVYNSLFTKKRPSNFLQESYYPWNWSQLAQMNSSFLKISLNNLFRLCFFFRFSCKEGESLRVNKMIAPFQDSDANQIQSNSFCIQQISRKRICNIRVTSKSLFHAAAILYSSENVVVYENIFNLSSEMCLSVQLAIST